MSGRRGNKLEKDAKRLAYYEGCDTPIRILLETNEKYENESIGNKEGFSL